MAQYLGKNTVVVFGTTTLNTLYRSAGAEESVDLVDKSAFADAHKSYLAALRDTTFSLEFLIDGTASWAACVPGTEGTLTYSTEDTVAGKLKRSAVAIVSSRSMENPYNELVTASVEWNLQAAWTEGTN